MTRLVFRQRAIEDLVGITAYSNLRFGAAQTRGYMLGIQSMCRRLASGDQVGRRSDDPIPGFWKPRTGSHMIFYLLFPDCLEIVRILHVSMNFEDHL